MLEWHFSENFSYYSAMYCEKTSPNKGMEGQSQGEAPPPPVFGRSVNPISTRGGGILSPPIITCPPGFSDLATARVSE